MHQLYRRRPEDDKWELADRDEELSFQNTGYYHAYFASQAEADRNADLPKFPASQYTKFEIDFYHDQMKSKQLRLGQAFVNECLPKYIVDPDLFYERNPQKAVAAIFARYIDTTK